MRVKYSLLQFSDEQKKNSLTSIYQKITLRFRGYKTKTLCLLAGAVAFACGVSAWAVRCAGWALNGLWLRCGIRLPLDDFR